MSALPEAARVEEVSIPGPHGPIGLRRYSANAATAALVWLHGGAFAFGDLDMPEADWVARQLAVRGVTVCSVDYRLATDGRMHPVPGDDVLAAWRWATGGQQPFGNLPVHLGGASAGGCLAAATAKRLRDSGEPLPVSLVLAYALVHAELPAPSDGLRRALQSPPLGAFLFDADTLRLIVLNYVGDERVFADPHAFAANGDHAGLPPTFLLNAECDTLRSSAEAFAEALAQAGVDVAVTTEPGTAHGYLNEPRLETAHRSIERIAAWLHARA